MTEEEQQQTMTDEEALMRIAAAMKENAPVSDDKQNVHTFLINVIQSEDNTKIGYLRDDKDLNELGIPEYTVRGDKDLALISKQIMSNDLFTAYFEQEAQNTLATSLSREGFIIRQATTTTKQVADATRRRKVNKGWFGKQSVEEQGGDLTTQK